MAKSEIKVQVMTPSTSGLEDIKLYCQPCDQSSATHPAIGYCIDCSEHLCKTCFINHKKAKPCRNHTLVHEDAMPKSQQLATSASDLAQTDELTKPCPKHKKEVLKFFCQDHNTLLCTVCGMLDHRACDIKYIPDIAEETTYITEYRDAIKNLKEILRQCQTIKLETRSSTEESNNSLLDALAELKAFRLQINQRLDDLEKKLEDEASSLEEKNNRKLQTTEETCNEIEKSMGPLFNSMKLLHKFRKLEKLFVESKIAEETIKNNKSTIKALGKQRYTRKYIFKGDTWMTTFQKRVGLGVLEPQPIKSICVKTSNDKLVCDIRGMVLQNNHLILIDHSNESIKMVDIDCDKVISSVALSKKPYGITAVTEDEVAVTLPWEKTIQIVSTADNELTLSRKIHIQDPCYGIGCYEEKLVVIYWHMNKFQILDKTGVVFSTVILSTVKIDSTDDSSDENYVAYDDGDYSESINSDSSMSDEVEIIEDMEDSDYNFLACVQCNRNAICVSDPGNNEVIMVNWQGEETRTSEFFGSVQGIALQENGMVFACDKKKGCVTELSSDCSKGNVTLPGLQSPYAICYDNEQKLYISSCSHLKKHDNFIKVYTL